MNKLKVNDVVVVLSGKDAGKTGKLISVNKKTSRVTVEGVNEVKKSIKPTQENPQGGFAVKLLPIHSSNIALFSAKSKKASKVQIKISKDGKKERVLKSCGTKI